MWSGGPVVRLSQTSPIPRSPDGDKKDIKDAGAIDCGQTIAPCNCSAWLPGAAYIAFLQLAGAGGTFSQPLPAGYI